MSGTGATTPGNDPVRARRAVVAKWTQRASRLGYLFLLVAIGAFFIGLAAGFPPVAAMIVVIALIAGCVLLAPAIILGYAVKAAEKEDRARGH